MDVDFKGRLSCNVSIIQERMGKKNIFLSRCEELGVSDFGDTKEESLSNLKSAMSLLIKNAPEKKQLLRENNPLLITRMFL